MKQKFKYKTKNASLWWKLSLKNTGNVLLFKNENLHNYFPLLIYRYLVVF